MSVRTSPALILVVLGVICLASCRIPEPPIPDDNSVAVYYDPEMSEAMAKRFPPSPLQQKLNERYKTALAKPVSVLAWEKEFNEWRVYFATNRSLAANADGTPKIGNAWGSDLERGKVRVRLPRTVRGKEADGPSMGSKLVSWIPGRRESVETKSVTLATREEMLVLQDEAFYQDLRREVEESPERDLFLFVHGFNVDFDSAMIRAAQVGLSLPFNGAIVAYSWPSQGGVNNYKTDEGIVADSVAPFVRFLDELDRALPRDAAIHILVHSMGNRLVLNGLNQLPQRFRDTPRFRNVILAAPDVGVSDFVTLAPGAVAAAERITLYVNGSDTALIASKALNGEQRIGDAFPPVVVNGVETIDASAIETSFMGHSYYGSNRRALSDLFSLIKERRPAAERPWLKTEGGPGGQWWVFASQPTEVRWGWNFEELKDPSFQESSEE